MNDRISENIVRNKITLISFICSILVIWHHTYNLETYKIDANSTGIANIVWKIENYWTQVSEIAVPIFFLLSGYLFFRTFSWSKLINKYKSRLKSIVIPYLVWCSIYYIYFVVLTNFPVVRNYVNGPRVSLSIFNWLLALGPESYYTLWFLKYLILFIALTPILYIFIKNKFNVPLGILIACALVINTKIKMINGIPTGLDMYIVGSCIAINYKDIIYYKNKKISYLCIAIVMIMLATRMMWRNNMLIIVFLFAIWFSLDVFDLELEMPWWIKITFFIYVFHDMVLEAIEKLFLLIFGSNPLMALLGYLFIPLLTLLIIILFAYIIQPIKTIYYILTGYR